MRGRQLPMMRHGACEVSALTSSAPPSAAAPDAQLTLAGELPQMAGQVDYTGRPLKGPLHRRVRGGLGFVPEERPVFMGLSVADNLKIAARPDRALGLFPELKHVLRCRAGMLSGSEQQMLTLGRTLAMKPTARRAACPGVRCEWPIAGVCCTAASWLRSTMPTTAKRRGRRTSRKRGTRAASPPYAHK